MGDETQSGPTSGRPQAAAPRAAPRLASLIALVVLAVALAGLGTALGVPLPWLIGPLAASAGLQLAGLGPPLPRALRDGGQLVLGLGLGLYFTPAVLATVARLAPWIALGIVWALLLGLAFAAWLRRSHAEVDAATAFYAGAIGGASEMAVYAERAGARVDLVAAAHSLRVVIVVLGLPFALTALDVRGVDPTVPGPRTVDALGLLALLGGALLAALGAERLRLPNAWMLGPLALALLLTAQGIEPSALPAWLSAAGQLAIGVALGSKFSRRFLAAAPRFLAAVASGTLALMAVSALFGALLAERLGLPLATLVVGTSPGGIAEMCITAKVLQLGVPVVTALHVTRLVGVLLLARPLERWLRRHGAL